VVRKGEQVFAYDTRKETYEHEVGVLLHERFSSDGAVADRPDKTDRAPASPKATAAAQDDRGMLPHAGGKARCWGGHVSCRALKIGLGSTLMTLGVGALATGALEYALAAKTHDQWKGLTQVDSRQGALRARGKNQALTGDVLIGVGAALTLTSSLTFALWHPTPSAADVARAHHATGLPGAPRAAAEPGQVRLSLWPTQGGGSVSAALLF